MENGGPTAKATESVTTGHIEEFARMVSARFAPLSINTDRAERFKGRILGRDLGDLEVFDVTANQHEVLRTEPIASQTPKGSYMLHIQLEGIGVISQDGREAVLQPGDMAFYDSDRGYSLSLDDDFRNGIMVFPRRQLAIPVESAGQLTATRISGTEGLGVVVVPFLTHLARNLDQIPGHSGLRLAHNALDMITTVLHEKLGATWEGDTELVRRENQLRQVRAYIEDNLADPVLNPQQIAAANFMSVRQLHAFFSKEGTTVSAWIRTRRLERCRADLNDRLQDTLPVSSIAARSGLVDAAYFSRLFKGAYGESPSDFRQRMRRRGGPE
ncbi:helix-turn-helix domain-containing protein [Paeniglutamicibacter cryotolerans]